LPSQNTRHVQSVVLPQDQRQEPLSSKFQGYPSCLSDEKSWQQEIEDKSKEEQKILLPSDGFQNLSDLHRQGRKRQQQQWPEQATADRCTWPQTPGRHSGISPAPAAAGAKKRPMLQRATSSPLLQIERS